MPFKKKPKPKLTPAVNPPAKEPAPDKPKDSRAVRPEGIKDHEQSDTDMMTRSPETAEKNPQPPEDPNVPSP